jgi:hypothetical protein
MRIRLRVVLPALLLCPLAALDAGPARAGTDAGPPPIEVPKTDKAQMAVCTDGKSHYVVIGPHDKYIHQLYYGDGKSFSMIGPHPSGMITGGDFEDPRFFAPTHNESFRGIDWRVVSSVDWDRDNKTCSLRCGTRTTPLTVMPAADARKVLEAGTFRKAVWGRDPYALARDDRGTYYYVDRGNTDATRNDFRVYVGKKGALKLQKMKDVASDSEGEVYSTASGDLRLITSHQKPEFTWVEGGKEQKLVVLPVRQNLNLVYTTLGVYAGQRLGTPCDDI